MPRQDYRYSKRGVYVPFAYRKCPSCDNDINPSRGPQGKAYKSCAWCCSPGDRDTRARIYKQSRLADARERGAFC